MPSHRPGPLVCSIGSTDPTAASGIGLDLRVFERLGVRAAFAVAAVTAQNARCVSAVRPIEPDVVVAQLRAVWEDSQPAAIRIGLLPEARLIAAVTDFLRELPVRPPIVVDPVLASTSGTQFLNPHDVRALFRLFTIATVITPNAIEAQALSGIRVTSLADARRAAGSLSESGTAALVKGGHLSGSRSVDVLAIGGVVVREFRAARLRNAGRGNGCLLAAAIAVGLARGKELARAVADAKTFVLGEVRRRKRFKQSGRLSTTA